MTEAELKAIEERAAKRKAATVEELDQADQLAFSEWWRTLNLNPPADWSAERVKNFPSVLWKAWSGRSMLGMLTESDLERDVDALLAEVRRLRG